MFTIFPLRVLTFLTVPLPGQFVLTATQKKDRSKLQTKFSVEALRKSHRLHGEESGQGVSFQPPSSQTECLLARVWAKVLVGQPKDSPVASEHHFSVFDNFFHLGGDSLAALRVLRMLASEFDDQAILHNPTGQIQGALSPANFQVQGDAACSTWTIGLL